MKPPPAPIRFLLLFVGGWVAFRVVVLMPERVAPAGPSGTEPGLPQIAQAAPPLPSISSPVPAELAHAAPPIARRTGASPLPLPQALPGQRLEHEGPIPLAAAAAVPIAQPFPAAAPSLPVTGPAIVPLPYTPLSPRSAFQPRAAARPGRWSGEGWLFVRDEGGTNLAPGGTLGGSQAGLRLSYRLNGDPGRPLSLSGRLYLPIERPAGAEAAIGLDWKPAAALPVHVLVERRQRTGREGRADFGVTLYGGAERRLLRGRVRIEAYGQAGIVGIEERDLFADGAARASIAIGPVEAGAGAWGGAQPGVSRLDVGPQATIRIPLGRATIRASAEYRFRIAGDAAPSSGPALTVAAGF